jgi:hypothetical protein
VTVSNIPKPPPGARRTSVEPNWREWPYTLSGMMDHLTHDTATVEEREAIWRAMADFDRQCHAWRHQPAGAASPDW